MKKAVMEQWTKALESGKYKQGKYRLKTRTGKYCCLGVLCELSGKGSFDKKGVFKSLGLKCDNYPGDEEGVEYEEKVLPEAVMKWAGMNDPTGATKKYAELIKGSEDGFCNLATLNDNGYTFKEIAAIIRKNYKKL